MLTAAVRDLHRHYPGKFITDVRTSCPDLWEFNPHITPIGDDDPDAEHVECSYPLINRCDKTPYHCLHGFIEFFNARFQLAIAPTVFKGDIHLSSREKFWYSQVHEVTRQNTPFWIVAAGGKHDVTIKWWQTERYQQVIDHFRGKIQFVQVGAAGNYHPKLDGVIDLRGRTSLRELVRLVYHSHGVLCSVTALMHLAAAVETKRGAPPNRPCVVIAGGREPAHWEAYPGHQFIHTIGALPCCAESGCWKDRAFRLNDGDERDQPAHLCTNVVDRLPRCMDLISPAEVIRKIEMYFSGGAIRYLTPRQRKAADRGVAATRKNPFDRQPLNIHLAGIACEKFVRTIPPFPAEQFKGRGIVICGGGVNYFTSAWVCINLLRRFGCRLPVQLWHLGKNEITPAMRKLVEPLGVECVDAFTVRKKFPARRLGGWELKPFAILHSPFREVLLLDADNAPVTNPEFLFETAEFRRDGAIFWPDFPRAISEKARRIWRSCGLRVPREPEFETGQILVDKARCWSALKLCLWFNENSDFYYQHLHGDKETFHLAFRKLKKNYALVPKPIHRLDSTMCQHDFEGRRIFQHRNLDKWDLFLRNRRIEDFWFEKECREYVEQLRRKWNGTIHPAIEKKLNQPSRLNGHAAHLKIEAVMISCEQRDELRRRTLENLAKTDWRGEPLIQLDDGDDGQPVQRQLRSTFLVLQRALRRRPDYILFLEDDLLFNRHLRHNLVNWTPLKNQLVTVASLYNPKLRQMHCDVRHNLRVIDPRAIFGSQAFLISKKTAEYLLLRWDEGGAGQDIQISRLAARLKRPIFYHAPSLVQHVGFQSAWGGPFHQAADFDPEWKA
jgi:ADP-heptose:LPS heptosyltransferase